MARIVRVSGIVALLLGVLLVRVITSAKDELAQADALLAQSDTDGAIMHYRRAARWYAPASPYHVRALDALMHIGKSAEDAADSERALSAYRAVRGSIMAARSFYVPEQGRLRAADQRIARLMSEEPPPGVDAGKSKDQIRQEHLALLEQDPGPNMAWTLVLLAGFALWVSSAFVFSARAIDEQDRWVVAEARKWGAAIVLGFGLFVLGMLLA